MRARRRDPRNSGQDTLAQITKNIPTPCKWTMHLYLYNVKFQKESTSAPRTPRQIPPYYSLTFCDCENYSTRKDILISTATNEILEKLRLNTWHKAHCECRAIYVCVYSASVVFLFFYFITNCKRRKTLISHILNQRMILSLKAPCQVPQMEV